jgi:hypothetical protein
MPGVSKMTKNSIAMGARRQDAPRGSGATSSKVHGRRCDVRSFPAGTCLMLKPMNDLDKLINGAMNEARRLADFKVYRMHDSDYLVFLRKPCWFM